MKHSSIWLEHFGESEYPTLKENKIIDVLIIGGGITGVSTLYHLINKKLSVSLVEMNRIGESTTAKSTGKVTYLQDNIYNKITDIYNKEVAKMYYNSQKDAIKIIKNIITRNNIDCNFKKQTSYLFGSSEEENIKIRKEKELLEEFGVKLKGEVLSLKDNIYSISVSDTYYFHPLKFVKSLAKISYKNRLSIYENTRIEKIIKKDDYYECYTEKNIIKAKKVVIASHYPFFINPFLFPLKSSLEKSYLSASLTKKKNEISGINTLNTEISFRYHKNYFIYLYGSHNIGFKYDNVKNFNELLNNCKKINKKPKYLWSNTDIITNDYLPYIGLIKDNLYIGTGYNTWGMTNGVLGGKILSDLITGKYNKYKNLFNPRRNMSYLGYLKMFKNMFYNIKPFIENKIIKNKSFYPTNVFFVKRNGKNLGIYIDKLGKEHVIYNKCPHLKCSLIFNEVEKTWDCPCHSSRFDIDGKCIKGPSKKDITYNG